jgi:hypothetical protein
LQLLSNLPKWYGINQQTAVRYVGYLKREVEIDKVLFYFLANVSVLAS